MRKGNKTHHMSRVRKMEKRVVVGYVYEICIEVEDKKKKKKKKFKGG